MTARHIDAWQRIQTRERNKILYFFKYIFKDWTRRVFGTNFPERMLANAFEAFYKKYRNNNELRDQSAYIDDEAYEMAETLYYEIKTLLEYWESRKMSQIDRIKDDQMFIRLVKIRHLLTF